MRIAIAGLLHETNTFSTLHTDYHDFRIVRGQALIEGPFWQGLEANGDELFPLFVAHATPSGLVTEDGFRRFMAELLDGIRACLPLDGLLLHLHGAMEVAEIGDGETAVLRAVRALVGPAPLIAVTLDLHANLAPEVVALSDLVTAYRTAPHRDVEETRERGAALLTDCLRRGIRPVSHLVKLPLLVAGEAAVTEVEPARSLFGRLPEVDRLPGILTSSILIGCAWTDSPYTRVSVVASGADAAAVRRAAAGLAREVWDARDRFAIDSPTASIDEALALACAAPVRPVFISDSGDNPTAGAVGDTPIVLERLVELGVGDVLVAGITDPEAVQCCAEAGVGSEVALSIGGKLDGVNARPYPARAVVRRLAPQMGEIPPRALVRIGNIDVVLQSDRRPFTELRHFSAIGLDPQDYKFVVVKLGYLFPELRDFAQSHIMALSPGFADQRLDRLPFRRLARPIYPLDKDADWHGNVSENA